MGEDPFTIFEILYKPGSVPKRELVKNFKLQKKVVKVDFTRQVKKSVGETSSIKRIEYVEDTNCEEITVKKCLPVIGLNQRGSFSSPSNLYNNYQGTRSLYSSGGSLSHPGPKVHQEVQQDDRHDR